MEAGGGAGGPPRALPAGPLGATCVLSTALMPHVQTQPLLPHSKSNSVVAPAFDTLSLSLSIHLCRSLSRRSLAPHHCAGAMEYEKSGISSEDVKRYAGLVKDPSTVTVMGSENLGNGVETGSTGERDMHSDATSDKHSAPAHIDGRREGSSMMISDLTPSTENSYGGGMYGTESNRSAAATAAKEPGHASDFQSAEGLESDMPDRGGIHEPPSSGDHATDITGIPYIQ